MKVVVIISADGEWQAVKDLLRGVRVRHNVFGEDFETAVDGRTVTFFHGGWGRVSAAATTQFVIDQLLPELIVNLGTCGGFEGRIEQGTVLLVERTIIYDILEQMTDAAAAIEHYSTQLDLDWLPLIPPSPVQRGLLVSGDRDIVAAEIPELTRKYNAIAADWESAAIAWVAKRNNQRLLILRGVSDLVGSQGGEAYGNYRLFLTRTKQIMKSLIDSLPAWISAIEAAT